MSLLEEFEKMIGEDTEGKVFIIRGTPGTGKSSFILTLLKDFLRKDKKCLLVTTQLKPEEVKTRLKRLFGVNYNKKEEEGKLKIMAAYSKEAMVSDLNELNFNLSMVLKEFKPQVVMFDSLTSLLLFNDNTTVTKFLQRLVMKLREMNASGFFVIDSGSVEEQTVELVSYFLDGILETRIEESATPKRLFRVFSMKFGKSSLKWIPFKITDNGFEFTKETPGSV